MGLTLRNLLSWFLLSLGFPPSFITDLVVSIRRTSAASFVKLRGWYSDILGVSCTGLTVLVVIASSALPEVLFSLSLVAWSPPPVLGWPCAGRILVVRFRHVIPILHLLLSMTSKTSAAKSEILLISGLKSSPLFSVLMIYVEERLSSSESEVISCRLRFFRDQALQGVSGVSTLAKVMTVGAPVWKFSMIAFWMSGSSSS